MTLYLKHRPKDFHQVMGNKDTVASIQSMLARDKEDIPHAFMLAGPSGCGKTTLARIIAGSLGCVGDDFVEVDSVDNGGIDKIRSIRKNVSYKPLYGTCRVWLLDECHGMEKKAQNALLKVLEDTPEHVYFILCTTEPQKMINTLMGRCSQFNVAPLNHSLMGKFLHRICKKEGVSISDDIIDQITEDSMCQPRNALNILDQIIDLEPELMEAAAKQFAREQNKIIDLCQALFKKAKWADIATILKGLEENEETIRRAVLGYCNAILLKKKNEQAFLVMDIFKEPFYDTGRPGLTWACYEATNN